MLQTYHHEASRQPRRFPAESGRDALRAAEVPLLTGARDVAIVQDGVIYTNRHGQRRHLAADRVFVTTGESSEDRMRAELTRRGLDVVPIGDRAGNHDLAAAFRTAAELAPRTGQFM